MGRAAHIARNLLMACGVLLAVLALVVAAALAFLSTEGGREWAAAAARGAAAAAGVDLRITGLGEGLPGRFAAERLVLADREGPWLEIEEPVIEWRPLALVRGVLALERVAASRVRVIRAPGGDRPETPGRRPALPELPFALRLGELDLPVVRLEEALVAPAAELSLTGGPASAGWEGHVEGNAGGASGHLWVMLEGNATARISGRADLVPLLPARLHALFAGGVELAGEARFGRRGTTLRELGLSTQALRATAAGRIGADGELDLGLDLRALGDEALGTALAPVAPVGVAGRITLAGSLDSPRLAGQFEARRVTAPGFLAGGVRLRAEAEGGEAGALTLGLEGEAETLHWELHGADPLVRGPARISATGTLGPDGRLRLDPLEAEVPDVSLRGRLELDPGTGGLTLPARVKIRALSSLAGLTRLDLQGTGTLDATLTLPAFDGRLAVTASGRLRDLDPGIPVVGAFASGEVALSARLDLGPGQGLSVTGIALSGPAFEASGSVRIPPGYERLEVQAEARLPDASVLTPAIGVPLSGAARASVRLSGPLGNPGLEGSLALAAAAPGGLPLRALAGEVALNDLGGDLHGRVRLDGQSDYGTARLATDMAVGDDRVELTNARLALGPATITGRLQVPFAAPPVAGRLQFGSDTVAPFLAGRGLDGDAAVRGRLELEPDGARQAAKLELVASALRLGGPSAHGWTADRLTADLRLADLTGERRVNGTVTMEALAGSGLALDLVEATVAGEADRVALEASARGQAAGAAIMLDGSLSESRAGGTTAIGLHRLAGSFHGLALASRRDAVLRLGPDGVTVEGLDLALGDGGLSAEAALGTGDAHLRAAGEGLPLVLLGLVDPALALAGTGRFRLDLTQSAPDGASGTLELGLQDLRPPDRPGALPVQARVEGRLGAQGLTLSATVSGPVATPVVASARLPLAVDLTGPALRLDRQAPLEAEVIWQGRAERLMALLPLTLHQLEGDIDAAVRVRGSASEPSVSGRITLEEGRYEHLTAGTLLRPLALTIEGRGDELRLTRFQARDGNGGRVTASGRLVLDPDRGYPLEAELGFADATLVRRDEVVAEASGDLRLGREDGRTRLFGRITTGEVEARLVSRLPPEVVDLEVVEFGAPAAANRTRASPESGSLGLDLQVEVPRRFFLRGRGLDSEWRGGLAVSGSAAAPSIQGSLRSVRGIMVILGKRFELGPSSITFRGGRDVNPELDIVATYQGPDLAVTARLTGTVSRPEIGLESTPALPQDEILARTLFGKSAAELTALEAVQLAAAVGELYGVSGGGGLLERARSAVGVDVLRVGTGGEEGTATVEAGKYVSENVYLGVEQGAAAQSRGVTIEVELTPNIVLKSGVREDGRSNVGIELKRDY